MECQDYETKRNWIRHLLYYIYPKKGNVWQQCLEEIRNRIKLFNGKRLIAVATDAGSVDINAVKEFMAECNIEWIHVAHDPSLREVRAHNDLWPRIETQDPNHVAFYAHAKGVTKPINPGVTVHPWMRMMMTIDLDYWPLVKEMLEKYPTVGAFKKNGNGFVGSNSNWHFSGSYYWIRCKDLFSRDWRTIDWCWYGVEPYPSIHFSTNEAGCLFFEGNVPGLNLYSRKFFNNTIVPAYENWCKDNRKYQDLTYDKTILKPR